MQTAKLFWNGKSQAVRLPKEYRFEGQEVIINKNGDVVMLYPNDASLWDSFRDGLESFTADYMDKREQPEMQEREVLFD